MIQLLLVAITSATFRYMARRSLSIPFSRTRLIEVREKAGLTLTALAALCTEQGYPVTLGAIGKVEGGVNGPSPDLLQALATALKVTVDDFCDES